MPQEGEPRLTRRQLFGVIGTTASGLLLASCEQASNPSKISLHITYPTENGQVATTDHVAGTISGQLQPQESIVVFLQGLPGNQPYHPQWVLDQQQRPHFYRFENGNKTNWVSDVTFGYSGNKNVNVDFKVFATLATKSGLLSITNYVNQCIKTNSYPGLNQIPAGIDILDSVNHVTRPAGT